MTPRLRKALEAWAEDCRKYGAAGDKAKALLAAWEAEPRERFEVGQRVRLSSTHAIVRLLNPAWWVEGEGQEVGAIYCESLLEPIPDTESEQATTVCEHHIDPLRCPVCFPDTPETQDEIRVGDTVDWQGVRVGVLKIERRAIVRQVDGCWEEWKSFDSLTKLPPALPDDHIDRHWIVGAWIVNKAIIGDDYIAVHEPYSFRIDPGSHSTCTLEYMKRNFGHTGWSFHPNSPIQEKGK